MKNPNYSNCVMYRFVCKDPTVDHCYVGSTCNWVQRKATHKQGCNKPNSRHYHLSIYQIMRQYGGWDNWNMILIERFPCENRIDAAKRERYWYETYKPSMNLILPYQTRKEGNHIYYTNNKNKWEVYNRHRNKKVIAPCDEGEQSEHIV